MKGLVYRSIRKSAKKNDHKDTGDDEYSQQSKVEAVTFAFLIKNIR